MSEASVEQVEVVETDEGRDVIRELLGRENLALKERVRKYESERRHQIDRKDVQQAIVALAGDLSGEGEDTDNWNVETLTSVNEAFDTLGIEQIVKEFTISVKVVYSQVVEITVEGTSLDEITDRIEEGEFDNDLQGEFDVSSAELEDRTDIEEA